MEISLSIVITVYKSGLILDKLINDLVKYIEQVTIEYEIILVDDGCPEDSWKEISKLCSINKKIKGIKLSRNYGQQIAMSTGIKYAKGTYTIIMDGDMQNPNNAVVDIYNILFENNTDIVYTVSEERNNLQNKLSSKLFWYLINKIFKLNFVPNQLMMKGFNSKFKDVFNLYNEKNRFVAGITKDIGLRTNILRVRNNKRDFGKSNYNFTKRFFLMIDIILSITEKPLNMIISFSIMLLILSALYSLYTIFNYFYFPNMPTGYPSLMILISFFGSLNLLVLGIISKYLSFINSEVKNRPLFTVENFINI